VLGIVDSEKPFLHTFHRAWSACVGLPAYDKARWKELEDLAWRAEKTRASDTVRELFSAIVMLLCEQGGKLSEESAGVLFYAAVGPDKLVYGLAFVAHAALDDARRRPDCPEHLKLVVLSEPETLRVIAGERNVERVLNRDPQPSTSPAD